MATVAAGVIIAWPSTAASIPSGWTRVDVLDSDFLKGAVADNAGDSGGAATHTHVDAHAHTFDHGHVSPGSSSAASATGATPTPTGTGAATTTHTHTITALTSASAAMAAVPASWSAETSLPDYYEVIWIESSGTPTGIPDGAVGFYNDTSPPTGWIQHVGSKGRYLRGATAAGDGGGTGSGGAHTHTASAHQHSVPAHTHSDGVSGTASATASDAGGGSGRSDGSHTHPQVSLASTPYSSADATSADTSSDEVEPPYHTLLAVENQTGGVDLPAGVICVWHGLLSQVPIEWLVCDGENSTPDLRGKYVKAANLTSEVGNTGGSETHTHTAPAGHSHTVADHTHTVQLSSGGSGIEAGSSGNSVSDDNHTHPPDVTSGSDDAAASSSNAQTVSTVNHEPPYGTIIWIEFASAVEVDMVTPDESGTPTITTPSFTVDWTLPGMEVQNDYQVEIYKDSLYTDLLYDSTRLVSSTTEHLVPLEAGLQESTTYYIRVTVYDTEGTRGIGGSDFQTSWALPSTISNLTVTATGGDST